MLPDWLEDAEEVVHVDQRARTAGVPADWPSWLPGCVRDSVTAAGIAAPWTHQVIAADAIYAGCPTAVATGTASGKTLAYLLPIMAATAAGEECCVGVPTDSLRARLMLPRRRHTALYLSPTKALAHDQLRSARALGPDGWRVTVLDGDSDDTERRYAREVATYVFTNPDMLHHSVLPNHARWSGLLQSLRYVVVDESHRYRGVFGAHVSAVLRRLRRLCHQYGSDPVFVCASATSSNAAEAMARLVGVEADDVVTVTEDAAPHSARTILLWEPKESLYGDVATLLARFVDEGKQTLAFVPSRLMAERVAINALQRSESGRTIAAYRAGYLASDRRSLEHELQTGQITGVAATNALELGIDVAGMDAVIIAGFPGTLASLWQQAGRAGRAGTDATVVLAAKPDPLDAWLFQHPEAIFDAPVETTVLHPANPHILGLHLCAAAQERPLGPPDTAHFGPTMSPLADQLSGLGLLRKRGQSWYWTRPERAVDAINLRSTGGAPIEIVESETGRVVGSVDPSAADRTVFPGAVYLHQGEQYLVEYLDFDAHEALVRRAEPGYYTQAQGTFEVRVLAEQQRKAQGASEVCFGDVELISQVTHYLRRDAVSGDVWDETPVEMPVRRMQTQAMWWLLPEQVTDPLGLKGVELGSGAHAAEHTAIGLLPAFAPCDRWDIGGLSTFLHPDTGVCTVFVHDGHPGGAGFARLGYERSGPWLAGTLERLQTCRCEAGCPRCCVSPACGNANQNLDKAAGLALVRQLVKKN